MKEKHRIQCQSQYELPHSDPPIDHQEAQSQHHESIKDFTDEDMSYEDDNVNIVRFDHIEDHLPQNLLDSRNGTYVMDPPPNVPTTYV